MTESAPYEVLETIENVEIRQYPTLVLAKVTGLSDDYAFRVLFRYITGENKPRKEVAMTVPVISTGTTYKRIAMTRPVISDDLSFSFVMPSIYSISTVPEPLDERVKMTEIRARKLAVLRFSGRAHEDAVKERQWELLKTLEKKNIKAKGEPFLMRYNGPGAPGFLRRNEIAVELVA